MPVLLAKKVAERVGFEPTCRLPDKTLSRRPRYDHFGTSPSISLYEVGGPKGPALRTPVAEKFLDEMAALALEHPACHRKPVIQASQIKRLGC